MVEKTEHLSEKVLTCKIIVGKKAVLIATSLACVEKKLWHYWL